MEMTVVEASDWTARIESEKAVLEKKHPGNLASRGWKAYSQSDEDGILATIFERIGVTNQVFVEFGAEAGTENNCRYLLENGWSGLWIEGNEGYAKLVKGLYPEHLADGRLKFISSYVTAENINSLILGSNTSGQIDLLSVDIDGNDYWVLKAIRCVHPRVIVFEHNSFSPPEEYIMPYNPEHVWDGKSSMIGASLVSSVRLLNEMGYTLVGTGLCSPNGFYVRNDLVAGKFVGPFDAENWRPSVWEMIANYPRRSDLTSVEGA